MGGEDAFLKLWKMRLKRNGEVFIDCSLWTANINYYSYLRKDFNFFFNF